MSDKIHFHNLSIKDIYNQLHTSEKGLSSQEALKRTSKYGYNELPTKKKTSLIKQFLAQFNDFMIIILIIAAGISFVASIIEGNADYADPIIILTIIVFNAVMGVIQESKAEHSLESLKKLSAPYANVLRDGIIQVIPSRELVPGDIISLETGNLVPADVRIINCSNLKIDESSLTGESMAVNKNSDISFPIDTPLADRRNMAYSSSLVTCGHGTALVVATGINTEVGHIAKLINDDTSPETPLQKNLATTSKYLGIFALAICFIIFAIGVFQGRGLFEMFMTSISLAVASIPEGLPIIVTIVLSLGVSKMAEHKAIIRKLPAVETLGSATYVCSDKTGTLTQNKMTVKHIFINQKLTNDFQIDSFESTELFRAINLCNNAEIDSNGNIIGDATETSLLRLAQKVNSNFLKEKQQYPRLHEVPFDSSRKIMSVIIKTPTGNKIYSKGAYDYLINRCSSLLLNGEKVPLTQTRKQEIDKAIHSLCENAERVLAVTVKDCEYNIFTQEKEENLTFIGLVGIIDPPKKEVKNAIEECKNAGLKTVMITGDHPETAFAIAKELKLASNKKQVITGRQIDKLSVKELSKIIINYSVFARVTPEHKVKIVQAFKKCGKIVAMTGDGVNDAPSISIADIGTCMGKTGTDVTKNVADLIITNDDFSTIVIAVKQGRTIYSNIQKIIQFLISTNLVEVLGIFVSTIVLRNSIFLLPSQILFINLVTDSFPAFALGLEKTEKDIMLKPPRDPKETIFSGRVGMNILIQSFLQTLLVLVVFVVSIKKYGNETASSMVFLIICLMQIIHAVNCKTNGSIFKINIFNNKSFNISFVGLFALIMAVAFIPFLQTAFGLVSLTATQWIIIAISSISIIPLVEISKLFVNMYYNKKTQ